MAGMLNTCNLNQSDYYDILLWMKTIIIHPFPPVYSASSTILILGSFPSVKSREEGFYYGHRWNRFWPMLERIYNENAGNIEERKSIILKHGLALWDSIYSCRISGSADSSIQDAVPNDVPELLKETEIKKIITNGKKAYSVYMEYIYSKTGIVPVCLPSTSPANAAWSLDALTEVWRNALSL